MPKPEELLAAGGYLSIQEKLKNETAVDSISARVYQHPALGDRPVVRLTADNLAAGDDLTLEFLGFAAPQVIGPIAKRQRQALGFPGWALVNDPKHARYALELVKGFKKAVRKSKAKPGHGYDEFVETSKQLGSSVAHFLPSFWEQVGREFIALDNATYASRAFGKAREAEKVHALKVDESTRQDAFLEFALAGAVSIKALTEYGKELLATHDPKAAWTFFRELCVRRILGGMPPWPAMMKDLQPLMKAAGLDQDQETQIILAEAIDSPAIARAAMGFWDSTSKSIAQLVKKNAHVAGVLLNMIPQTSSWRNEDIWPWLKHLESWGILGNAWKEDIPQEAGPQGGAAAWLARVIQSGNRPRQRIFDLLEAMAPRLRKDNVPVNLYSKPGWRYRASADVDLLDLALELKVPVADPTPLITFDLEEWASPDEEDKDLRNRPRDPVFLVADPRFTPMLRTAVQEAAGDPDFEIAAMGKQGLKVARRDWLASIVEGLSTGGLPRVESSLQLIENKAQRAIFVEFPEELEKLQNADVVTPFTRTIAGGLLDEYGWPALEKVFETFVAAGQTKPLLFGQFPYLIITDKLKVIVLKGPDIVHEAELKLKKGQTLECLMYADGDLLVFTKEDYRAICFWNSDPQPGDPSYAYFSDGASGVAIDLPGGGTLTGGKLVHRGDKDLLNLRGSDEIISDGKHYWIRSQEYDSKSEEFVQHLHEFDPATGKRGRQSMPSFYEDFVQPGTKLEIARSSLLPFGSMFDDSILGSRDGLIGVRVRSREGGAQRIEGIDGRALEMTQSVFVTNLLTQPGTDLYLPIVVEELNNAGSAYNLWDSTGNFELSEISGGNNGYYQGQVAVLPPIYLHAFQLRDATASKKLRSITKDQVQSLLEAEQQDFEAFKSGKFAPEKPATGAAPRVPSRDASKHCPQLDAAIHKLLGAKLNPRLMAGVRGVVIESGDAQRRFARVVELRSTDAGPTTAGAAPAGAELAADPYLRTLHYAYRPLPNMSFFQSAASLAEYFTGTLSEVHFPEQWFDCLQELTDSLPERFWLQYCNDIEDKKWIPFAELWCDSPFQKLPGWFRKFGARTKNKEFMKEEYEALKANAGYLSIPDDDDDYYDDDDEDEDWKWVLPYIGKSSRFLIRKSYSSFEVLEYSPDGTFEAIPDLILESDAGVISPPSIWSSDELRTFTRLAQVNPITFPPVELLNSIASEAKTTPAEVALVWFGLPQFQNYSSNFMPTHLREGCKLKTKECSLARESLKSLSDQVRKSLVRAVLTGDPSELWENPPTKVALRIQNAWGGNQMARLPLAPEWVAKVTDALRYGVDKAQLFEALNAPEKSPLFSAKGNWSYVIDEDDDVNLVCDDARCQFSEESLQAAGLCVAMLTYGLPVGDPARNKMPEVYQAVLNALANPGLLLASGTRYEFEDKKAKTLPKLLETTVGKPKKEGNMQIADDGLLVGVLHDCQIETAFRPAKLTKSGQTERLANQLKVVLDRQSASADEDDDEIGSDGVISQIRFFRSDDMAALVKRITATPVPAGSFETNPILSAPDVVQQVVKTHKVSEPAAAYYLQLLALADPTDKNITLWNGWTPAALKKAAKELVDKKLILEATRSRAGRKFFLPGGWEDLKAPHLPLETWKMPLFQMSRDAYQRANPPLQRILPLEPVHTLFAKAWKRVVDGDVPKYDEVK